MLRQIQFDELQPLSKIVMRMLQLWCKLKTFISNTKYKIFNRNKKRVEIKEKNNIFFTKKSKKLIIYLTNIYYLQTKNKSWISVPHKK